MQVERTGGEPPASGSAGEAAGSTALGGTALSSAALSSAAPGVTAG